MVLRSRRAIHSQLGLFRGNLRFLLFSLALLGRDFSNRYRILLDGPAQTLRIEQ